MRHAVDRIVDVGGRRPLAVLAVALCVMVVSWTFAWGLELRPDFMELLPRDSPGFRAFERQLDRVGGRATVLVIAESPDRRANERFVERLADLLEAEPEGVHHVERGTKEARRFFDANRWLYATALDLEEIDRTLDRQIALRSGLVVELDPGPRDASLGLDARRAKWDAEARRHDAFPSGWFADEPGTMVGLRVVSTSTGMADARGDRLLAHVKELAERVGPRTLHPDMVVGFAGDLPRAALEKRSLLESAAMATGVALALIVLGIAWFYRSAWAVPVVALPPLFGAGCAFAFAKLAYGYVNASGAFLGAIILGNGINFPIVLLSRYREFRGRGMAADVARRDAVWNAFRAELVGASVAAIAYGSLTITRFRGFAQFGVIGLVGMMLVWISMIPCVPAMIAAVERMDGVLPAWLRQGPARVEPDGSRGPLSRVVGDLTERRPRLLLAITGVITVVAMWPVPGFLRDPWEYDFDRLGSAGARGAMDAWTRKAERVFGGKAGVGGAMMIADTPAQVPALKARILANDAADPAGRLIEEITTIDDVLPGSATEQQRKLAVISRIHGRLTPAVLAALPEEERRRVEEERPPADLAVIGPRDLPPILRHRFEEASGAIGAVFHVRFRDVSLTDGHILLRIARTTDDVELDDGQRVATASRSTVFAEMIRSMKRDAPLATMVALAMVALVVAAATANPRGSVAVLLALLLGVAWMTGGAAWQGERINFVDFIALPITFGIGAEYPFNIYDRARLLAGDVTRAVKLHAGAVALCSYTTVIGYGSLVVADNLALRSFGRMAVAGEIACLFAALIFLPALLHATRPRAGRI